jgi:glutathione synthase/RimK-type ligase-like ATP-grasp enzyme
MNNSVPQRIGFVTSAEHRSLVTDDLVLAVALERRGATVVPIVWAETAPHAPGCDLLLLRSCWDYHLNPQAFRAWVIEAQRYVRVINPAEIVLWNMDKRYLGELEQHGFAVPHTVTRNVGSSARLVELMQSNGFSAAVIKPAISLSAYETHLVHAAAAAQFQGKLDKLLTARDMLIQEFISEISSEGEWSLIFLGGQFSHAVKKFPKRGDFRVQHEYGGSVELVTPREAMVATASSILRRFAPGAAYCRADLVPRQQGAILMELELIDPVLHFELAPAAAERMAAVLLADRG